MGTDRSAQAKDAARARAREWKRRQDPRLLAAIRRAFCGHQGGGGRHTCLRPSDRRMIAQWSNTIVRTALGLPVVEPEPVPDCWFPRCRRGEHHHGQHSGIAQAGRRLAELEAALADGRLVWRTG